MLEATQTAVRGDVSKYWSRHNITLHRWFSSPEESFEHLAYRNDQYPGYIDLMPVAGHDGKRILDYGCGPGHDLVGFCHNSLRAKVVGADVSFTSLDEAVHRLNLHGFVADLVHLNGRQVTLPFEDGRFDLVHCSGVLHHTEDPAQIMKEFRRVLVNDGEVQIMVYNYESVWLHLYVAYVKFLTEGRYAGLDIRQAFAKTTDGEDCPIARPYRPSEFIALCERSGFRVSGVGCAASAFELSLLPRRYDAIMNMDLRRESREFLLDLEVDKSGIPYYNGLVAGIDLCVRLNKS